MYIYLRGINVSKKNLKFDSRIVHIGNRIDETSSTVTPLHLTSTFKQKKFESTEQFVYARTGNPTLAALEESLANLESAENAYGFSSGMAAMTAIFLMYKPNDHILLSRNVYGGVFRLVTRVLNDTGVDYDFIDTSDLNCVKESIKKNTKHIHIELPSNPLLELADIEAISKIAKENNCILSVDNTFMSPYGQQPLKLGADIVMHSTTKFLGGHSDIIGGALMLNGDQLNSKIQLIQNTAGSLQSSFDAWLLLRSIKTLTVRVERQFKNSLFIAKWLEKQKSITKVIYPGLTSHPQHSLACKQQLDPNNKPVFGSMISFELSENKDINKFAKNLNLITLAESLGGIKSLISCPYSMTHASVPKEEKEKLGINKNLLRLSIGIEDPDDIISEIDFAINQC